MNEKNFLNNREYICAYCLSKNEDKLCDDYSQDCDKVNVLKNDYSDYLEDCLTELFDEKQKLMKYLENTINRNKKFDKENNCEWQGYNFYQTILDKIKEGNYE